MMTKAELNFLREELDENIVEAIETGSPGDLYGIRVLLAPEMKWRTLTLDEKIQLAQWRALNTKIEDLQVKGGLL